MDLRGRRGCEGHRVERRVQLLGRRAELLPDDDHDVVVRERRGLSLQLGQLGDPFGREHIAPAGRHLADLHVGGTQLLEHRPDAGRAARVVDDLAVAEDDAGEPAPDAADRGVGEGDVEARRVDRVVDLLEAQVLDDRVPAGGREPL